MIIVSHMKRNRVTLTEQALADTPLARAVYRKRRGEQLTLREAAEQIGVSVATVQRVETLRTFPRVLALMKIAKWLGIPLEDLT